MLLALSGAYLLGSVPVAWLLVRLLKKQDIRTLGSGNIGATNAKRVLGWPGFAVVFVLDAGKGALAWWLGLRLGVEPVGWVVFAAIFGHCYPVWLKFKGGKGVATFLGGFAPIAPLAAGLGFVAWIVMYARTRLSSVGSLSALALAGFVVIGWDSAAVQAPVCAAIVVVLLRHRENIERLLAGQERTA